MNEENERAGNPAMVIEPDECEQGRPMKKQCLLIDSNSSTSEQDMANALLALKTTSTPSTPVDCQPLFHPYDFLTAWSSQHGFSSAGRGSLSLVDYDEVAAISEDEHEDPSLRNEFTRSEKNAKKQQVTKRKLLHCGGALTMPMLATFPDAGIPCSYPPHFLISEPSQRTIESSYLPEAQHSPPTGSPLPPPPCLPKLLSGQKVLLS